MRAAAVRIGDGLLVASNAYALTCSTVASVYSVTEAGISSPYTLQGTIVVNGVAASVYSDATLDPASSHVATVPARLVWSLGHALVPAALHSFVDELAFQLIFHAPSVFIAVQIVAALAVLGWYSLRCSSPVPCGPHSTAM